MSFAVPTPYTRRMSKEKVAHVKIVDEEEEDEGVNENVQANANVPTMKIFGEKKERKLSMIRHSTSEEEIVFDDASQSSSASVKADNDQDKNLFMSSWTSSNQIRRRSPHGTQSPMQSMMSPSKYSNSSPMSKLRASRLDTLQEALYMAPSPSQLHHRTLPTLDSGDTYVDNNNKGYFAAINLSDSDSLQLSESKPSFESYATNGVTMKSPQGNPPVTIGIRMPDTTPNTVDDSNKDKTTPSRQSNAISSGLYIETPNTAQAVMRTPEVVNDEEGNESSKTKAKNANNNTSQQTFTPLHKLCYVAVNANSLWQYQHLATVTHAAVHDENGCTPLHVFSENEMLAQALALLDPHRRLSKGDNTDVTDPKSLQPSGLQECGSFDSTNTNVNRQARPLVQFMLYLFKTYPAAMMTQDGNGNIPFEYSLREWIHDMLHSGHEGGLRPSLSMTAGSKVSLSLSSLLKSTQTMTSKWPVVQSALAKPGGIEILRQASVDIEEGNTSSPINFIQTSSSRYFPSKVSLTAKAHYALHMLSAILEHLERRIESVTSSQPRHLVQTDTFSRSEDDPCTDDDISLEIMDGLRYKTVVDIRTEIIKSIASIPNIVKAIFLLSNPAQKKFVLESTIIRRVLASKYSVGPWLTKMLQCEERRISDLAIDYLKHVSDPKTNGMCFQTEIRSEESRRSLMPKSKGSSFSLTTELHQEMSRLENLVPSLLAMGERQVEDAATTRMVQKVLDRIIARPFAVTMVFLDAVFLTMLLYGFRASVNKMQLQASPTSILRHLFVANMGIFYFVLREIGKAVSLCVVSNQPRLYFYSIWNWADFSATLLALLCSILVRSHISREDASGLDQGMKNLVAITTGFLWLRVLNFLKGMNRQLATFVLAILQISRDIFWFCVILTTMVISFSQMFFTLTAPDSCANDDIDARECAQSEYYLKTYAILLGEFATFERERLTSVFSVILLVIYSFMVVLILLNILIAVASDSYEKCLIRSPSLFGRARVMLIAEVVSLQSLLKKNERPSDTRSSNLRRWSENKAGALLFFAFTTSVLVCWSASELLFLYKDKSNNIVYSLGLIIALSSIYFGMIALLSFASSDKVSKDDSGNDSPNDGYFQRAMLHLLGSSYSSSGIQAAAEENWQGRISYLKGEMHKIAKNTARESQTKLESLQHSLGSAEERLQSQIMNLSQDMQELKGLLKDQKNNTEERSSAIDQNAIAASFQTSLQQILAELRSDAKSKKQKKEGGIPGTKCEL